MGDRSSEQHSLGDRNISMILAGVGSAALVVTIYHCIAVSWRCSNQPSPSTPPRRTFPTQIVEMPSSIENSTVQLIPAHKYQKGTSLEGDDGMCSVCLCEFEEGEEMRTLPICLHSYHAPCIDMWLYSHSNCSVCRADATPSPQIFQQMPDVGSRDLESGLLQNISTQSLSRTLM